MGARQHRTTRNADLVGACPALATTQDLHGSNPPLTGHAYARRTKSSKPLGINLRTVAEALVAEGLDPATEFARMLKGKVVRDAATGEEVIDLDTGERERKFDIDGEVRVRMLSEILQYTQPKLKSVEVKMSGSVELTSEQIDARIDALLAKATPSAKPAKRAPAKRAKR